MEILKEFNFKGFHFTVVTEGKEGIKLTINNKKVAVLQVPSVDFDFSKYEVYCKKLILLKYIRESNTAVFGKHHVNTGVKITYAELENPVYPYTILQVGNKYIVYSTEKEWEANEYDWKYGDKYTQEIETKYEIDESSMYWGYPITNIIEIAGLFVKWKVKGSYSDTYKFRNCWQVGDYLVTLLEDNNTVTIKAFIKVENDWRVSNLNNAGFLEQVWSSVWINVRLGDYWHRIQDEENGSCDWNLIDTPITVNKLFKTLYEYTDWVVELDKDRQAGEWEVVNVH
jgi:hypothetical protein